MTEVIEVGSVVSIEGSDTLWVVQDIDKNLMSLVDDAMGIIELDGVPLAEVVGVLEVGTAE